MNVLVLETNAAQAATIRRVVIGLCARLTVVQSIEAALPLLRDNAPDVVLLPALVSPVDEKQLLETLRALPHGGDIEILITPVLSIPVEHCAGSPSQRWPWKAARRRVAEPPSDEELRHFEERLRWSFARARARRERSDSRPPLDLAGRAVESAASLPLSSQPEHTVARERRAPAERRRAPRFMAEELRGLRGVRIPLGPMVSLVDLSAGGALVESDEPLGDETEASLELSGAKRATRVPFRVVRSWVSHLNGQRRFRSAFAFSEPLDLTGLMLEEQTPEADSHTGTPAIRVDTAFETILAPWADDLAEGVEAAARTEAIERLRALRVSAGSARGPAADATVALIDCATAAADTGGISVEALERLLGEAMPALVVRFSSRPEPGPLVGELLYFRVPTPRGAEPLVLNIEVPPDATLEAWQFRLLKAATCVAGLLGAASERSTVGRRAEDRRRHARADGPLEARRFGAIDTPIVVQNISEGGCFVNSLIDTEPGGELVLGIALPDGNWITVKGEVVHGQNGFGFAVRFLQVQPATREALARLVAARLDATAPVTRGAMVTGWG